MRFCKNTLRQIFRYTYGRYLKTRALRAASNFRTCFFELHRVSLGKQTVMDFSQPLKARRAVREFLIANWGNLASVAGLLVSLGALLFARSAAQTAKLVRQEMQRYSLHEYLSVFVARFQEFLLLMRLAKWELAWLRTDELIAALTWAISKWDLVLGTDRTRRLTNAQNLLRQIRTKLDASEARGLNEEMKRDLLTSAQLVLEEVTTIQGQISRDLETTGVEYER